MQIQAVNNYNYTNTNFKSAIPTVYWEKMGDKFEIVGNLDKIKRLQKILVRRAQGNGSASKEALAERKKVMGMLYKKDRDYHLAFDTYRIPNTLRIRKDARIAGSFYPPIDKTGWKYGKFNPMAMFLTGEDVRIMSDFGKGIGREIKKGSSVEKVEDATVRYVEKGRDLVSMPTKEEMHVIVEKCKDGSYKILKADMYPSDGPKSPYVIMGYYK